MKITVKLYLASALILLAIPLIAGIGAEYTDTGGLAQNVDGCGILNTTNAVYTLTNNVNSTSTCFNSTHISKTFINLCLFKLTQNIISVNIY